MLDGAKAGHFAYIGDSILGNDVNLGAGTKLANLKMIPGTVSIASSTSRVTLALRASDAPSGKSCAGEKQQKGADGDAEQPFAARPTEAIPHSASFRRLFVFTHTPRLTLSVRLCMTAGDLRKPVQTAARTAYRQTYRHG